MAQDGVAVRAIESLPPPVEGPTVWYGPDMMKRTDWVHALSAADLAEIERAMRPLAERQADIARITKADFPLPTLAPKLASNLQRASPRPWLCLAARAAGRAVVDPRGRDRLFRHRLPLRQCPLAERQGARARPRARPRPQRREGSDRARLPDARAPDLSHGLLRCGRPACASRRRSRRPPRSSAR
mgnify:CR=1 FL=1